MKSRSIIPFALLAAALSTLLVTIGCEWGDDDHDHNPPAGMGSIIIDNYTSTDIEFFVDGTLVGKVNNDRDRAFDFAPGVYRVVLNDEDDRRSWANDVDVLEGRLTVLTVRIDSTDYARYDVRREIQ